MAVYFRPFQEFPFFDHPLERRPIHKAIVRPLVFTPSGGTRRVGDDRLQPGKL